MIQPTFFLPNPDDGGSLLIEFRDRANLRSRFGLTAGEYRTLANIVCYETNERVAEAEGVSVPTIGKRMSSIIHKMQVATRVGAVREFLRSVDTPSASDDQSAAAGPGQSTVSKHSSTVQIICSKPPANNQVPQ